jgi:hypothetical protein
MIFAPGHKGRAADLKFGRGVTSDQQNAADNRRAINMSLKLSLAEPGTIVVEEAVIGSRDTGAGGVIGIDHAAHVLRIESGRQCRRAHQIADHHGEVAALGLVTRHRFGRYFNRCRSELRARILYEFAPAELGGLRFRHPLHD